MTAQALPIGDGVGTDRAVSHFSEDLQEKLRLKSAVRRYV